MMKTSDEITPLHLIMRSYSTRERVAALIRCSIHEADEGDAIVELLNAIRKSAWRLGSARLRANVGLAVHQLAVELMQSSIRLAYKAAPHRVTRYPVEQRSA